MSPAPVAVSVVIPVRDEAVSIAGVVQEVDAALAGCSYQVIVVDDGSRDGTWFVLERLAADRPPASFAAVRLRQRAGKSAALGYRRRWPTTWVSAPPHRSASTRHAV